jgi:hypothetical protein
VARNPIIDAKASNNSNSFNDGSETAKDLVTIPFDPKIKGAKFGSKKEFTKEFRETNTGKLSSNNLVWKVKVLTLGTDQFIHTIHYYQPDKKNDSNSLNSFEQFANSFALTPI